MAEKFEDQYLDVLQNIEFALVTVYRQHAQMTDLDASDALNALIRGYHAETRGRAAPDAKLNALAQEAYLNVKAMCDWRLGRETMKDERGQTVGAELTPKTRDEIIACLKRIRRSVELWHQQGGRRGYYDFVSEFVR